MQVRLGFRCYSKKVSLGSKFLAGKEFKIFLLLTAELEPVHRTTNDTPQQKERFTRGRYPGWAGGTPSVSADFNVPMAEFFLMFSRAPHWPATRANFAIY